jgi:hypothetical protein
MVDHSFSRMHQWEKNKLIGKPFAMTLAPEVRPDCLCIGILQMSEGILSISRCTFEKMGRNLPS